MKQKILILILTFTLISCGTVAQDFPEIPFTTALPSFTPSPTFTITAKPTSAHTQAPTKIQISTATSTLYPTDTQTLSATPQFGLCPLDMSHQDIEYLAGFSAEHPGIDVVGPPGEPIISPGNCEVNGLFIDHHKTQGIHLVCNDYPLNQVDRLTIGHIDLTWNDFETLKQYGISIDTFFDDEGQPKIGVENIPPRKNFQFRRGQGTIAFNGNTGDHVMPFHIHIDVWKITNNQFENLDPDQYLACK